MNGNVLKDLKVAEAAIKLFCEQWKIIEFSLFGSVITADFQAQSDIDVLVSFSEEADLSLADIVTMKEQLSRLFGREVDIVDKDALRNPFRKNHILSHREVIYAAR